MTIQEVQSEKKILEEKIMTLISEFEDKVGAMVTMIERDIVRADNRIVRDRVLIKAEIK